jgi:hypothetical protein
LKGLICFHLHELFLLAVIMPATMSIVVAVPNVLIGLKKPSRYPSCLLATRGVEVVATGSMTEINQQKREQENGNINWCHNKLKMGISVNQLVRSMLFYPDSVGRMRFLVLI